MDSLIWAFVFLGQSDGLKQILLQEKLLQTIRLS